MYRKLGSKDVLTLLNDMGDEGGCRKAVEDTIQHFRKRERASQPRLRFKGHRSVLLVPEELNHLLKRCFDAWLVFLF